MSAVPWQCVVLAIDPDTLPGWAVHDGSTWVAGEARTHDERLAAVDCATSLAEARGLPVVVVGERWAGGWSKGGGITAIASLGAQWGRWEAALEGRVPARRIIRVYSATWRARVIGGKCARPTEEWKRIAVQIAASHLGYGVSPDASEAVCMALWARHAEPVGKLLPKRRAA